MMDVTPQALADYVGFQVAEDYNASRLLWDNLDNHADRPAVLHDSGIWTYQFLVEEAARIGNALLSAGVLPGERVLLFMDDEPAYPAAIMGAMRAGLVPMLINTLSPEELIRFYLEDSGAVAAIVSSDFLALFNSEVMDGTKCRTVMDAGRRPWVDQPVDLPEHPTRRQDMAFWMYSSGSTGKPKGVVHKHEDPAYIAQTYARSVLEIGPSDICFSVPKIFFAYGFGNAVVFPMSVGAASVLLSGRPTPDRCFDLIERYKPTVFFALPTLYTALARDPSAKGADLSSVRLCISAAEVLSAEIARAWQDRFGHLIVEGLGSTEMLHIYLSNDTTAQKHGSAGRVVDGFAVRLITPDGHEAEIGEEGVMQVMGLSGAEYYWNRPDKTSETMKSGWLDTGDRFIRDEDGFYFFRGRADDLVKVSGQWVYPLEIELALNEHPKVIESCVQAIDLPDGRQTIAAWVALHDGGAAEEDLIQELQAYAKAALLPHKYPRKVMILDSLPKTGTDKIDRQALRRFEIVH
ncbi:MAG: benzoate-CoA ligase family protein [Pseudomonadota bacterium]